MISSTHRPISDHAIIAIGIAIGIIALLLNAFCLYLIRKTKKTCKREIYAVLILLQIVYTFHNFHFTILFVPFIYLKVGGGYCIGLLCEPHYVSFSANVIIWILLNGILVGLFIMLLFLRHQSIVSATSPVKFGRIGKAVTMVLIMTFNCMHAVRYAAVHFSASASAERSTMKRFCNPCDWIEQRRNYGVIPADAAHMDKYILGVATSIFTIFVLACTVHIFYIIYARNQKRSCQNWTMTIRQTRQSLIQIASFGVFFFIPFVLFISLAVFKFEEDSVVLIPTIFLFSLNSLAHSFLTIVFSPTIRARIRHSFRTDTTTMT